MEECKLLKRKYGEAFAKFCRQNFPTILEEDGRLSEILESRFRGMGYECFSGSVKLEKVFFPKLEGMGTAGFKNCPNIKEVDLPKLKRMRSYCFYDSGKIEKINMPPLDIKGRKCFRRYHLNTLHKTYLSKKHRKRNPVPQCFRP